MHPERPNLLTMRVEGITEVMLGKPYLYSVAERLVAEGSADVVSAAGLLMEWLERAH